jgi:hypothetical protein
MSARTRFGEATVADGVTGPLTTLIPLFWGDALDPPHRIAELHCLHNHALHADLNPVRDRLHPRQ